MRYHLMGTIVFKNAAAMAAAMPACNELVQYLIDNGVDAQLLLPMWSGATNRAAVLTRSSDLVGPEQKAADAMADPRYLGLVKKLGEYIDGTQTYDEVWRLVR